MFEKYNVLESKNPNQMETDDMEVHCDNRASACRTHSENLTVSAKLQAQPCLLSPSVCVCLCVRDSCEMALKFY